MGHLDNLIRLRIYAILELIIQTLGEYMAISPYIEVDVELAINLKKFFFDFHLINGSTFYLSEEYALINYRLEITRYHYGYVNQNDQTLISFDNSPHHAHLYTFPHHKHLYPKSKYPPVGFSGDLKDALEEIKWILEYL